MAREKIQMKPNRKCKQCWGRGVVRVIAPNLNAELFREIRPCTCVKAVVKLSELKEYEAEQSAI